MEGAELKIKVCSVIKINKKKKIKEKKRKEKKKKKKRKEKRTTKKFRLVSLSHNYNNLVIFDKNMCQAT